MSCPQQPERVAQLAAVLVTEVRNDDHQGALALAAEQLRGRVDVVGMGRRRLHIVEFAHEEIERANPLARCDRAFCACRGPEGHRAHFVTLAQRDIGQQHDRIQHVIEEGAADALVRLIGTHASPAVDEQHDALVTLVLKFADDRLAEAARGLPIDVAYGIAQVVLGQLVEVRAFAAAPIGLDAELREPPVSREPGVTGHLGEIGKHAARLQLTEALEQLAEPEA